jgi:hypothetical protein
VVEDGGGAAVVDGGADEVVTSANSPALEVEAAAVVGIVSGETATGVGFS